MLIAKIEDGKIVQISNHTEFFPNTSFPTGAPDSQFLSENGFAPVQVTEEAVNPNTHRVVPTTPYIDNGIVKTYEIQEIGSDEARARLISEVVNKTQNKLDAFAMSRGYDNIMSACTYATSSIPKFAQEGQYCMQVRDATWNTLYTILAEVEAGNRPAPSKYEDIEPELPVLEWPN